MPRIRLALYLVCLDFVGVSNAVWAQLPTVSDERLGVDALRLQDGTRLYGFALGVTGQGAERELQFSVERGWLEVTHPTLATKQVGQETLDAERAKQTFIERVNLWIAEREQEVGFTNMLRADLAKFESKPNERTASRFVLFRFPSSEVQELKLAEPAKRKVAGLAYMSELSDVATSPASILEKRLVEAGVDVVKETVDLSDDLPVAAATMSERQWAAKQALFEYQFRKPLEYQGKGDMLLKKSDEAVDVAAMMQALMGSASGGSDILQLGAELGLPEFQQFKSSKKKESDWSRKITQEAEEAGFRGCVVFRLTQELLNPEVAVETYFFARASENEWFAAYRHISKVDTRRMTDEMRARVDRIKQDPQIAQVTELLSGLGLGGNSQLDTALMHGAATEAALESARREFTEFANRYGDDITFPVVPLPAEQK